MDLIHFKTTRKIKLRKNLPPSIKVMFYFALPSYLAFIVLAIYSMVTQSILISGELGEYLVLGFYTLLTIAVFIYVVMKLFKIEKTETITKQ